MEAHHPITSLGEPCGGERGWVRVSTHVVDKPDESNAEQTGPVELDDKPIGGLLLHVLLGERLRLLDLETEVEQEEREDDTDTETGTPDGLVVGVLGGGGNNVFCMAALLVCAN